MALVPLFLASMWACSPDAVTEAGFLQVELEELRRIELEDTDAAFIGRLRSSNMVAFSPEGRIAVADGMTQRILLFRPDGRFQAVAGSRGEGPGEFEMITGVAWGPHGDIWATDYLSRRISVFDGGLSLDTTFAVEAGPPGGIQMAGDRALLRIGRMPREGTPLFLYSIDQRVIVDSLFGHGTLAGQPYVPYTIIYRVQGDTLYAASGVSYPLSILSMQGDTLGTFGTPPPSIRTMRLPEYGEFAANPLAGSEWQRSFGTATRISVAHDSLIVVQHHVPSRSGGTQPGRFFIDVYDRGTLEKLAEDVEMPGFIVSTHDDLVWVLTHEPPDPWTFTGFRLNLR